MTEMPNEVHLALSGRITFEQDISVAQGAQVIAIIQAPAGLVRATPGPEPPRLLPELALTREESTRELPSNDEPTRQPLLESPRHALDSSGAKTIPEKITAFAAYLTLVEGHETFGHQDLRRLFERARERIPTHFSRDFDKAVRAGWIHEGTTKGAYYLSDSLRNLLEDGYAGHRGKRTRRSQAPATAARRKPRSIPVPDDFAEVDHIPASIDGVPPYQQVKLKRDRLLWAIKLAKELGVPALKSTDVTWLTDKLGDAIISRDITAHFKGLHRDGLANRSVIDNAMRITEKGEEYLSSL
ncbi:hypothetical protein [Streptomyces vilmorinianum]|uniref:hypothetical protein n=1 Tax=Streptomyces vilmorinianum TaxID=3051092 RepID=UPI0010FAF693|nr:hypothetical protein [Streptomyces vilmorinianum]